MMTRQHFELIASVLRDYRGSLTTVEMTLDLDRLTRDFADALYSTNQRFDRERFYRASGVK